MTEGKIFKDVAVQCDESFLKYLSTPQNLDDGRIATQFYEKLKYLAEDSTGLNVFQSIVDVAPDNPLDLLNIFIESVNIFYESITSRGNQ